MENSALRQQIEAIREEIKANSEKLDSSKLVYELRKSFLDNKNGKISALMKEMKNIPAEERADFGKNVNELKQWALDQFEELDKKMKAKELQLRYEKEKQDVTMPAKIRYTGNLHPVTQMKETLIDIFAGMGFEIYEGAEIENDYYNFTALNTPKDHPARDMQDTFYLSPEFLLRTQTSAGQIHVMENKKPPIKILSPGRVFRSDDDATHSPMCWQM